MTVYQVWDFDPMDGSWGADYCAATYAKQADAEAEAARRTAEWKADWLSDPRRAKDEPEEWRWHKATVKPVELL